MAATSAAATLYELAELLQSWPEAEFNIEGNPTQNLMDFIRQVRPQQATFVPDSEPVHQRPRLELPAGCPAPAP